MCTSMQELKDYMKPNFNAPACDNSNAAREIRCLHAPCVVELCTRRAKLVVEVVQLCKAGFARVAGAHL